MFRLHPTVEPTPNMKTSHSILFALTLALALPAWSADDKTAPAAPASDVKMKRIGLEEFEKLRTKKDTVVLDVRTEKEWNAGHIAGAVHIDVNAKDFEQQVGKLGTNKTFLVHCAAGVRSRRACARLNAAGFPNLYDIAPGFNGWQAAGKPVEK